MNKKRWVEAFSQPDCVLNSWKLLKTGQNICHAVFCKWRQSGLLLVVWLNGTRLWRSISSANARQDPLSLILRINCCAMERWHRTMKNRILLESYYLYGELEHEIDVFVEHYNNNRYHETLNNVTPAGIHFGPDKDIITERKRKKLDNPVSPLATSKAGRKIHPTPEPDPPLLKPL